jgi:serine/threonine protein kinase/WD40 repeat protein
VLGTNLSVRDRLGPYQIVAPLGAGGMGVVYRARDSRLGRDVALKVLRAPSVAGADLKNILREARTAGSLNHPNIVAVYDVGIEGDVPYVVTELLAGETLRDRLRRGPVPYRKAVEYGIQIAQALDAAHAKGIWHRDVKPANIFLTDDSRVKLLDFGIAKVVAGAAGPDDSTITEASKSQKIVGTAAYMSPEQVLGSPLDHRTDIFSLGAVLYEMFTGAGAFVRDTSIDTLSAVLHVDPPDPLTLTPDLSPAAVAVVRRCLEKNREERFQSVRDLAFDLQQLRETTAGVRVPSPGRSPARRWLFPGTLIVAALAVGAAGTVLVSPVLRPPPPPSFEQLTFRRGRIGGARFSSDGQAVVYSQAREANALEVWRMDLAENESRPLGYEAGTDVLAARAGELALGVRRRFILGERFVGTLAFAPSAGGSPKEVAENIEDAEWDPSGRQLAVVRSTGEVGGNSQIEFPLGTTRYTTAGSIRFLRVSRDGRRIAFLEDPQGRGIGGRVKVLDLSGGVKDLTDEWPSVRGLSWSKDGDEVWFAAGAFPTSRALRAVNLRQRQRVILETTGSLTLWDIAADGRMLLTQDEERGALVGQAPGENTERDLSWLDNSSAANLSRDGRSVMFTDRGGIYIRATDGSDPIRLGFDGAFGDELSPDGQTVLATAGNLQQLFLVPKGAGEVRTIPAHNIIKYRGAHWFRDGRRIVFVGQEARHGLRSYIQNLDGSAPKPLTPENFQALSISPKGDFAAAIGPDQAISLWPIAGGPSRIVSGPQPGERPVAWSEDGQSLWLFRRGEVPAHVYRLDIASGRRELWKTLIPSDSAGVYSILYFQVTPDGRAYAYSYMRLLSQLYLAKGLK